MFFSGEFNAVPLKKENKPKEKTEVHSFQQTAGGQRLRGGNAGS